MIFYSLGDWGERSSIRKNIVHSLQLQDHKKDWLILLGDNFYPMGVNTVQDPRWVDFEKDFSMFSKAYAVLGNHDYLSNNPFSQILYSSFSNLWSLPFYFYDVCKDNTHFFFLDTISLAPRETLGLCHGLKTLNYTQLQEMGNHQLQWLEKQLASSTAPWKIVCGHYPIYSNGQHGDCQEIKDILLPLFVKYNLSMYLSGHDHSMQHIYQHNIHFFVLGSGSMNSSPGFHRPQGLRYFNSDGGIGRFDIRENQLHITFLNEYGNSVYEYIVIK